MVSPQMDSIVSTPKYQIPLYVDVEASFLASTPIPFKATKQTKSITMQSNDDDGRFSGWKDKIKTKKYPKISQMRRNTLLKGNNEQRGNIMLLTYLQ